MRAWNLLLYAPPGSFGLLLPSSPPSHLPTHRFTSGCSREISVINVYSFHSQNAQPLRIATHQKPPAICLSLSKLPFQQPKTGQTQAKLKVKRPITSRDGFPATLWGYTLHGFLSMIGGLRIRRWQGRCRGLPSCRWTRLILALQPFPGPANLVERCHGREVVLCLVGPYGDQQCQK